MTNKTKDDRFYLCNEEGEQNIKIQDLTPFVNARDTYVAFAKKIGANFLDLKGKPWTEYENMKYLYGIIERGDDVYFAGKFDPLKLRGPSALRDEINFLQRYGYEWTSDFTKMIKR